MNSEYPVCCHCRLKKVHRPKGLCWKCYYTPEINVLYPSRSKYARRGVRDFAGPAPLPRKPTIAPVGSSQKIAVLARRAQRGLSLFHPHDRGVVNLLLCYPELQSSNLIVEMKLVEQMLSGAPKMA